MSRPRFISINGPVTLDISVMFQPEKGNQFSWNVEEVLITPATTGPVAARVLAGLGDKTLIYGYAGGVVGRAFSKALEVQEETGSVDLLKGPSRANIYLFVPDPAHPQAPPRQMGLKSPRQALTKSRGLRLLKYVERKLVDAQFPKAYVILGAQIIHRAPPEIIQRLIQISKSKGYQVAVDFKPDLKREEILGVLESSPSVIKANLEELALIEGVPLKEFLAPFKKNITDGMEGIDAEGRPKFHEIAERARNLGERYGMDEVIVTLEKYGALVAYRTNEKRYEVIRVRTPTLKVKASLSAGDATLAGFLWKRSHDGSIEDSAIYAVASGSASAQRPGADVETKKDEIESMVRRMKTEWGKNLITKFSTRAEVRNRARDAGLRYQEIKNLTTDRLIQEFQLWMPKSQGNDRLWLREALWARFDKSFDERESLAALEALFNELSFIRQTLERNETVKFPNDVLGREGVRFFLEGVEKSRKLKDKRRLDSFLAALGSEKIFQIYELLNWLDYNLNLKKDRPGWAAKQEALRPLLEAFSDLRVKVEGGVETHASLPFKTLGGREENPNRNRILSGPSAQNWGFKQSVKINNPGKDGMSVGNFVRAFKRYKSPIRIVNLTMIENGTERNVPKGRGGRRDPSTLLKNGLTVVVYYRPHPDFSRAETRDVETLNKEPNPEPGEPIRSVTPEPHEGPFAGEALRRELPPQTLDDGAHRSEVRLPRRQAGAAKQGREAVEISGEVINRLLARRPRALRQPWPSIFRTALEVRAFLPEDVMNLGTTFTNLVGTPEAAAAPTPESFTGWGRRAQELAVLRKERFGDATNVLPSLKEGKFSGAMGVLLNFSTFQKYGPALAILQNHQPELRFAVIAEGTSEEVSVQKGIVRDLNRSLKPGTGQILIYSTPVEAAFSFQKKVSYLEGIGLDPRTAALISRFVPRFTNQGEQRLADFVAGIPGLQALLENFSRETQRALDTAA